MWQNALVHMNSDTEERIKGWDSESEALVKMLIFDARREQAHTKSLKGIVEETNYAVK